MRTLFFIIYSLYAFSAAADIEQVLQRWNCIIFIRNDEIWTIGVEGGDKTQMTKKVTIEEGSYTEVGDTIAGACFSPDGKKIVFDSSRETGVRKIYVMNVDGSNLTKLTNSASGINELAAEFSPDGKKIVYESMRDIHIIDVDGKNEFRLTEGGKQTNPSFSLDGKKIIYEKVIAMYTSGFSSEIWSIAIDGKNDIRVLNNEDNLVDNGCAHFSPDGKKIVFSSNRDGNYEIYSMNEDGSNQVRLTNNESLDTQPVFSPDGNRIVFVSDRSGANEIFVMDNDGSGLMQFTDRGGFEPSFAPMLINGKLLDYYGHWHEIGE